MLTTGTPSSFIKLFTGALIAYGVFALATFFVPAVWVKAADLHRWLHPTAGWLAWLAAAALRLPVQGAHPRRRLIVLVLAGILLLAPLLNPALRPATSADHQSFYFLWPSDAIGWPIWLAAVWLLTLVSLMLWPRAFMFWTARLVSYALMVAAALGIASHNLKLALIYNQVFFVPVALPIAIILFLLGVVLLMRQRGLQELLEPTRAREDELISTIGLAFLVAIAFTTGLTSFISLQAQVENALYQHISLTMNNRRIVFVNAIDAAYLDAAPLSRNPEIARIMQSMSGKQARDRGGELLDVAADSLPYTVRAIQFRSVSGKVLVSDGAFEPATTLWVDYRNAAEIRLNWRSGQPFVEVRLRIDTRNQEHVGEIIVELPAPALEQLVSDTYDLGRTGEMLVCGSEQSVTRCLASRHRQTLLLPNVTDPLGQVIQDALDGESSSPTEPVIIYGSSSEAEVVTYGPVGQVQMALHIAGNGLAMMIKIRAEEFYQPVRAQLQRVLPILFVIIVAGSFMLRRLIAPLIRALNDKEARFRELTELSSDWYWLMDAELNFVQITGKKLLDSGIHVDAWLGRSLKQIPARPDRTKDLLAIEQRLLQQEPFYDITFRQPDPDSSNVHFLSLSGAPLYDATGRFLGYRGVGKNVTRRKQAEEGLLEAQTDLERRVEERTAELSASNSALGTEILERRQTEEKLKRSEARFRSLTELSSDWYWEVDPQYRFVQISGEVARKGGFSAMMSLGKPLWEQQWVIQEANDWDALRQLFADGQPFHDFTVKTHDFDGNIRYLSISGQPDLDDYGQISGYRGIGKDVTEKRVSEERIHFMAHYDALTHLPNRVLLTEQVRLAIERARRKETGLALLFIDLDRFKAINDSLGHEAGDQVLRIVAQRLSECVRDSDMAARLGGDEFVVALENITDAGQVSYTARRILDLVGKPFRLGGGSYNIGASIGISLFPEDGQTLTDLLKNSDAAMYRAKEEGRNGIFFFSNTLNAANMTRFQLENDLRRALEEHQLELYYQPKLDIFLDQIVGVEALLRWHHPDRGVVSPVEFIPVAEECGLIGAMGEWVIQQALSQLAAWDKAGLAPLTMAVNLSPKQLQDALPVTLASALQRHGLKPERLELELTESLLLQRPDRDIRLLESIQASGIRIALDDFGTGFSSLSSLATLPINCVKMDRTFIARLPDDVSCVAINRSILTMARGIGLEVVAEGVETLEQWRWLEREGCHQIQGFYFCVPLPASDILRFMNDFAAGHVLRARDRADEDVLPDDTMLE